MEYITNSPAETEALGKELAKELKCGDFVAMFGDLGVGKRRSCAEWQVCSAPMCACRVRHIR